MELDMVISAVQLLASGEPAATINHLQYGKENQRSHLLQGAWTDISDMYDDADNYRRKYSIQHIVVAPFEETDRATMMTKMLPMLAVRFNFPICEAVVVEHEKDRADPDAYGTHWHVLVAHFDPTSGKVRDWWMNRFKHELMARIMEHRLGHRMLCGFYHDQVLDTLREEGAANPGSDLVAVANALEAAWSRGSRPDGTTITKAEIKMHEAVGRDIVALKKICRAAWAVSKNMDQFNAALADVKSGLYAQLAPNPPPNWAIYDADGMVGTVAGMTKSKKTEVTAKLGDPANDDWHRTYHLKPEAPVERGALDSTAGADLAGDPRPDRIVEAVHQLAHFEHGHDDAEAERVFEAEMNALPASRLNWCESMARYLTRSPWADAMHYFNDRAQHAREYITHGAAKDFPQVTALLTWVRDKAAGLMKVLDTAREAYAKATQRLTYLRFHNMPTDKIVAAEKKMITTKAEWGTALQGVKAFQPELSTHEGFFQKRIDQYRATTVANRIAHSNRQIRIAERCKALIDDDRGPGVLWIDPETLYEIAYDADRVAKPAARWKVAGPPDEIPDFEHPDESSGPKPP
jgi:hypothetical protein